MGFQPCRLIAYHSIARRMTLIEGIFCKVRHFIEYFFCHFGGNAVFHTARHFIADAVNEIFPFLRHNRGFFLTHGTAHQVASSQTVSSQITHNLHNLFLIDDTAVSIFQNRLQSRMGILNIVFVVFPFDILGNKIHGTRTIEGNPRNQILQAGRLQFPHELLHATTFQLEHAFRFPLADELIHRRVIIRQMFHIQFHAVDTFHFLHSVLDNRQSSQPQKVHFQKPQFFQQCHGVLGIDLPVIGTEGHIFHNRFPTNDNPCRMGGRMSWQTFQTHGHINQMVGIFFVFISLFQVGVHLQGFFDGDAQFCGNHFGNPVHIGVRHCQCTTHVFDGSPCRQGTECDNLCHMILAILGNDIINNFLSAFITEVHVNIRHADTFGIQETLKNQVIPQGIDGGNLQAIRNHTAGSGTTSRTYDDAMVFGILDKVPNNEEIIHIAHGFNGMQFVFQSFLPFRFRVRIPHGKPIIAQFPEIFRCCFALRHIESGQFQIMEHKFHIAPLSDFYGIFQGFRHVAEKVIHFFGAFHIKLSALIPHTVFILHSFPSLDTQEDIVRHCVLFINIMAVIGGNEGNPRFLGHTNQCLVDTFLFCHAVILQFQEKIAFAENFFIFQSGFLGVVIG